MLASPGIWSSQFGARGVARGLYFLCGSQLKQAGFKYSRPQLSPKSSAVEGARVLFDYSGRGTHLSEQSCSQRTPAQVRAAPCTFTPPQGLSKALPVPPSIGRAGFGVSW